MAFLFGAGASIPATSTEQVRLVACTSLWPLVELQHLEPEDQWLSKAAVWHEKDIPFCTAVMEHRLVDSTELVRNCKHHSNE
jgi:hypothetical protein